MAIRNTQELVLVPAQPTDPKIRSTQDAVSVVAVPTDSKIRSTQDLVLAVAQPSDDKIRNTQQVLLVVELRNLLRQPIHKPITAWRKKPEIKPRLGFLQSAALLAAQPHHGPHLPPAIVTARRAQPPAQHRRPQRVGPPSPRRPQPFVWIIT